MKKQPRKKAPAHTPHPEARQGASFTELIIQRESIKGLETLLRLVRLCPLPGAKVIADKLSAGIVRKTCGRSAGTMP